MMRVVSFPTDGAPPGILDAVQALCTRAFEGDFAPEDWDHACGGTHVVAYTGAELVAHGALVERRLRVGGRTVRAGYVEAVAADPSYQGQGFGTAVMEAIGARVRNGFELGVLSTGEHDFYARVGWERWRGPTFVRDGDRVVRTVEDDDGIMFLRTGAFPDVDPHVPIECDTRSGDDW